MRTFRVRVNGELYEVEVEEIEQENAPNPGSQGAPTAKEKKASVAPRVAEGETDVKAPMPGVVVDIRVSVGDQIQTGKAILVLEAMKMENEIPAPVSGTVKSIGVSKGQSVNTGETLAIIG